MNVHFPQCLAAAQEVRSLAAVGRHILNAQDNRPALAIIQDALLGAYKMTGRGAFLRREEVMQLAMSVRYLPPDWRMPAPAVLKPVPLWTGSQAYSMCLPDVSLDVGGGEREEALVIRRGEVLRGRLDKRSLARVMHAVCKLLGTRRCIEFLSDCQRLANAWLEGNGFSIGLEDCTVSEETQREIDRAVRDCTEHADAVARLGRELGVPFEAKVSSLLARMLDITGAIAARDLRPGNALKAMVSSGSKGSEINISQIMGCVGQQSVEGARIDSRLSCFRPGENTAASRGFVDSSYARSLTAQQMFFHAMGGREGIVDTSVKTAICGYLQRQLIKGMESLKIEYDGTVRNAEKQVVSFVYGGDGLDAKHLQKVELAPFFRHESAWPVAEALRRACLKVQLSAICGVRQTHCYLPVHLPLLLQNRHLFCHEGKEEGKEPEVVPEERRRLVKELIDELSRRPVATLYLRASLAFHLVEKEPPLTRAELVALLRRVREETELARATPGEHVGALAAQSVGEPVTQLTLNTFHSAGIAAKNVTLGVPRMVELVAARKTLASPTTYLRLNELYRESEPTARLLQHRLPAAFLKDVTVEAHVAHTRGEDPEDWLVRADRLLSPLRNASPHVILMELDTAALSAREITEAHLREIVRSHLPPEGVYLQVAGGRLRLRTRARDRTVAQLLMDHLRRTVKLCGVPGITGAFPEKVPREGRAEWMLTLSGCNLQEVWEIPFADWRRTSSNDLYEVWSTLGIEAALMVLFAEMKAVLSFDGSYINDRHIMLVAETMTQKGILIGFTRFGQKELDSGPLVKCTFEMMNDIIFESAAFEDANPLRGVSDSIMAGTRVPGGTGMVDVLPDEAYMKGARSLPKPAAQRSRITRTYFSEQLCRRPTVRSPRLHPPETPQRPQANPSPQYVPESPQYSPRSPQYSPRSPQYSPRSPEWKDVYSFMSRNAIETDAFVPSSPTHHSSSPRHGFRPSTPAVPEKKERPAPMDLETALNRGSRSATGGDTEDLDLDLYDEQGRIKPRALERALRQHRL